MIPERTLRTGPGIRARRGDERYYEADMLVPVKQMSGRFTGRILASDLVTNLDRRLIETELVGEPDYEWFAIFAAALIDNAGRRVTTWHTARFRWVMSRWLDTGGITLEGAMLLEEAWVAENVRLIKTIPPRYHDALREALIRVQPEQPFNRQALRQVFSEGFKSAGYNLRRLTRDQTTKYVGQLNQFRQTEVGIDRYKWLTAGDERVRPSHRANEGLVFFWDSPPANTGHPGEDVNCRCVALPVLS